MTYDDFPVACWIALLLASAVVGVFILDALL
jgi:hypothetical protein